MKDKDTHLLEEAYNNLDKKKRYKILMEDLQRYLSISAGHYDEAAEAEDLLEEAYEFLKHLND